MSRGRSALSIFISNWPSRAFSPRSAARSRVSTRNGELLARGADQDEPRAVLAQPHRGEVLHPLPLLRSHLRPEPTSARAAPEQGDAPRRPRSPCLRFAHGRPGARCCWCSTCAASSSSRSPAPWSPCASSSTSSGCWSSPASTGLGGGFLRDVLIDATPPAALADWRYLLVPVAAGLVTFVFHPALGRLERVVNVFDAAGLGTVLRHRRPQGPGLRARSGAGGADGDGHRHRRRDRPRPACRAPAGGVLQRALRHPCPAGRHLGGGRLGDRAARRRPSRFRAWPSASGCGCWRCGATGTHRCHAGRPASSVETLAAQPPRTRSR